MIYKNIYLHNVSEIIDTDDGILLTRIPERLRVCLNEWAQARAVVPAGCEMRFNLESREASITLKTNGQETGIAEVYQGSFLVAHYFITGSVSEIRITSRPDAGALKEVAKTLNSPFDPGLTRIILPHRTPLKILDIQGSFSLPEKQQMPAKKYLAYGSSITFGTASINPSGSYAMRTAEILGFDLLNLGFGGGAHCEKEMADYIAGRQDWDFATLEMGINMVRSFDADEFKRRVEYFISRIAIEHPGKYIFCIDMFPFRMDLEGIETKSGIFRKIVKDAAAKIKSEKVIHIDGRDILRSLRGLTADLVHPAPAGMEEMALNLSRIINERII